jgi:hypothetical protein
MKYAVEMGSGAMIHTKFLKDWFSHLKVDRGILIQTHRQQGDLISLLLFFQNNEGKLKKSICLPQQEVLRVTNRLLSVDTTRAAYKTKKLGHTDRVKFEMGSGVMIYIPTFVKVG